MHFKIGFENDLIPICTYLLCRRRRRPVFTSKEDGEKLLARSTHTHVHCFKIIFRINTPSTFHWIVYFVSFCLLDSLFIYATLCALFVQNSKCCAKGKLQQAFPH